MNEKLKNIFVLITIITLTIIAVMVTSASAEDIYIDNCTTLDVEGATYYLTADIINSTVLTCMHVTAENVTLDGQGHIIDGIDPAEECPGVYSTRNNTTVKNCVITDWVPGIWYVGVNRSLIRNNTLYSNGYGIIFQDSSNNTIYNNLFNNTNDLGSWGGTTYKNFWNTTRQPGTRIYSDGTEIGGNYWTDLTGTGYSDTCMDADHDGFCDEPYTLAENNTDHLPLSDEYRVEQGECWNDTFDDETKIAEKNYAIVEDGNVEIDFENVTGIWRSSSIGQGLYGSLYDMHQGVSAIVFNLTGDGRWNAIMGRQDPGSAGHGYPLEPPHGFYWDGTQWIRDDSCIAGFPSDLSWPAIVFNITGDGRWNAIDGSRGYYWNDNEWVSDTSIVSGIDGRMTTIAFNVTGDGMWNAIGYSKGYYWNGTEWVEDPRLGLGGWVQVAFNLTSDGRWNAISGTVPSSFYGSTIPNQWYWNGTGWVEEPLIGGFPKILRNKRPVIAFSIAGDGRWNVISGISGYNMFYPADITSQVIDLPADNLWLFFFANDTTPDGTEIAYKILDEWNNTLMEVVPGQVISDVTDAKVRLFAELRVNSLFKTPVLHDWRICCVEGLPGGVLKEKKRLTFDPNSSTSPGVAADSEGNIHILWNEDRSSSQLYYKKLASNGTVLVNDKMVCGGSEPRIAVDSSCNVHVAFTNINVSYMKLDNIGNILVAPKQVIGVYYYGAKAGGIAVDRNSNVHIVGCSRCGLLPTSSTQEMTYVQLDNNGDELVNYTIDSITSYWNGEWSCMDMLSGIAVDSEGNAYTAYSKGSGVCAGWNCDGFTCYWPTCAKVWYVKIDGDGVHKQELTGDLPLPSLFPSVCMDSGDNAYVIWSQHNGSGGVGTDCLQGGGFDFYLTKFDKSGNRVVNSKRLTYEDYPSQGYYGSEPTCCQVPGVSQPIIDTESGILHMAFSRESKIYYMAFDASGSVVTDRMLLSLPSAETTANNPSMDAVSDGSHIVWDEKREHDPASEIYYARLMLPSNRVILMSPPDQWTPVNVNATYTIGILSTVPYTDTFNLTLENLDGALVAELGNDSVSLDTYASAEITLTVGDTTQDDYCVRVRAESQTNPSVNADITITTSVLTSISDLTITAIDAYHNDTNYPPYFNLSNEVDVEVENIGTANAGAFNVSLYVDDEFFGKQTVTDLELGESTTLQFIGWTPEGTDCEDGGSPKTYTLKAIADCDSDIAESNETNNESTVQETAYWAGWSADEELNLAANGTIRGGMIYTTGDGGYVSSVTSTDIHYDITLSEGASVEHARLYVYYTWCKDDYAEMKVSIGGTEVSSAAEYNDRPCNSPAIGFNYPYGTYVYDLTSYVSGTGTYTVTVERVGGSDFCIAAPGMLILYEDATEPEREYWILEGADILEGGRRGGAGYLSLEECTNKAIFTGDMNITKVINATLGMVLPWGGAGGGGSYYWFNDDYLGDGSILGGYTSLYQRTVDGMSMYVSENNNAQIGVNVSDIIDYIVENNNSITIGDDGDSMMAANAFLLIEYGNDTTPPNITDHAPVGDENWVGSPITVTFSEPMNKSSAEDAFSTVPVISGTFEWFVRTMTFTPDENLACNTTYNVTIGTGAKDRAGNNLGSPFNWEFTTQAVEDTTPPNVTTHSPTGENVSIFTDISVTFSELMNHTSTESAFSTIPDASGTFTWNETTMTFLPDVLEFNTTYNVTIAALATDLNGNTLDGNYNGISEGSPADDYTWQFTTEVQGFKSYDYDGFPLTTKSSGTVNGGVFISYGDNDRMENAKVAPYVTNLSVPNGTPVWAKLYMHLWGGNPYNGGTVNVTFNGHNFSTVVIQGKQTSDPHVLGTGCGTWWLFFNVTDLITPGDINRAQVSVTSESMDGRIARIVLVEAYEGGDDPQNVMYWVNDGHMNLHYNSSEYPWCIDSTKAWFNGTVPSGVTQANLTGIWLTGSYEEPDYFYFNPPDAPDAPNGSNINWDIGNYSDYQFGSYDPWTGSMSYHDVAMGGGYSTNYFDIHSNTTTNTSTIANILKDDNNYAIFWRGHDDNDDGWIYGAFSGDPTTYEGEGYVHAVLAALVLNFEGEDITPPYTDGHDPAPGDVNVAVDTNITVHVKDSGAGVNVNSIEMKVNNVSVIPDISGTSTDYELFYDPPVDFNLSETVNVSLYACDLDDNCMPEAYLWEFTIESGSAVECGDVDGENGVTIGDGIQVAMYTIYGPEEYPLTYPWAADVDCENGITIGDGIQIAMSTIYGTEQYPLECC